MHEQVVLGEDEEVADLPLYAKGPVVAGEVALDALSREVGCDALREQTAARSADRLVVDVRREHLEPGVASHAAGRLAQRDGDRVGLLAGRAAGDPGPHGLAGRPPGQQPVERDAEGGKALRVAKERGHAHEQIVEERVYLDGLVAEQAEVLVRRLDAVHVHPSLDAALQRRRLVAREVVSRVGAEQLDGTREVASGDAAAPPDARGEQRTLHVAEQRRRALLDRQDVVNQRGRDGAVRHPDVSRGRLVLHHHHARDLLDLLEPERAVRSGARQDHADGALLLVSRQRAEEVIDREREAPWRPRHPENAIGDVEQRPGRGEVDPTRRDGDSVARLGDRHPGVSGKELRQEAGVSRRAVHDHHERQVVVRRHVVEEPLQGVQASGRRAHADNDRLGNARHFDPVDLLHRLCPRQARQRSSRDSSIVEGRWAPNGPTPGQGHVFVDPGPKPVRGYKTTCACRVPTMLLGGSVPSASSSWSGMATSALRL